MSSQIPSYTLNNGAQIPVLGFGVFQAEPEQTVAAVSTALEAGYRHIDTAAGYGNERQVGEAVRGSGLDRSEVTIETKIWVSDYGYEQTLHAFDKSATKLGVDTIDVLILHQPMPQHFERTIGAYRALERLLADGRVAAIGVSNFMPEHLTRLLAERSVVPAVNQVELHPLFQQKATRAYCLEHGIAVESYSPLMRAGEALEHPVITNLAQTYGKTPAQVILRWHVQSGFIVIPKSVKPERIRENLALFDFELSANDMRAIEGMDREQRIGADPDTARFK